MSEENVSQDQRDGLAYPETRVSPALMLAQRIIDLFDQAGATDKERRTALDLARRITMDSL